VWDDSIGRCQPLISHKHSITLSADVHELFPSLLRIPELCEDRREKAVSVFCASPITFKF
jgi:hypothetical protein